MKRLYIRTLKPAIQFGVVLAGFSIFAAGAERSVEGAVYYRGREPVADAAVQLEDMSTLQVISHTSDRDGHFKFLGLSQDKDYQIRAMKNGHWSKPHTLSRFSSRSVETVELFLRQKRE